MVEFRADEKTAEKLTEIATTLDISRSDLLLSMVKFALTNHQWARFGLTHKTLPRYEENPIMATKKFSPAQIAAQKLFAERARAGTLGKGTKRKANPDKAKPRATVKRAAKPKYSAAAVNKAIASSRSKISASEGKTIHRLLKGRRGNPAAAMMTGYQVICMHPKKHVVGVFKTMAEAKQIATALANAKGVAYAIKTVKVHKAHFAA